ncbi:MULTISPECIES: S49 family peptidase [unclassified Mesorhizobium]|uniref:S49 family peptidase n=1 Tax=unclassified Mesorhizobium TaxID=325217 RepID=UPI0011268E22|nr:MULTISPECIES: S49 family peptidase [unclassified Mesorhizobium]MCA0025481.1 S49 family peptidase [Mesorhizobium sp. B263B1A]TPJ97131.1 S49 family peptidase [Mesorhizobium sp. B2-5-12]TPK27202.1 S49 family peptidase [Mesorhizobium sp. B2-5-6]
MHYLRILAAFAGQPWAMQPEKLETIASFLMFKAKGGSLSDDEVQARIGDRRSDSTPPAAGGIAVLPVHGVISQRMGMMSEISGGTSTEALAQQFRAALSDDAVKAIVFSHDSPGGGTYGVDELAAEIRAARGVKPIIAQVDSLSASASYYLASQADEIVVTPGGEAGSIGVYSVHQDISKMLENEGVKPTLIKAKNGIYKAETANIHPLSEEAHDYLQQRVDVAETAFISAVAAGRRVSQASVRDNFGKGRMFGAAELVKRGMADRVGTMQDTLQRLGASSPRLGAAANTRRMFAAGETPQLSQIEEVLREAGFPNALATAFVSRGKGALQSESGHEETRALSPDAKASLQQFLARLGK